MHENNDLNKGVIDGIDFDNNQDEQVVSQFTVNAEATNEKNVKGQIKAANEILKNVKKEGKISKIFLKDTAHGQDQGDKYKSIGCKNDQSKKQENNKKPKGFSIFKIFGKKQNNNNKGDYSSIDYKNYVNKTETLNIKESTLGLLDKSINKGLDQ